MFIRLAAGWAVLGACGCASYQPMPASDEAVRSAMAPRQPDELVRAAESLQHPLLPPVTIGSDGTLTPQGAAVVAVLQNPSLRAARSRRGVAAAQLLQAGILPNPQLSASMDFPVAGATDEGTVNAFGLGATWDVTSLIGRDQARLSASHEAEAVDLEIAWSEWQVAMGAQLHAVRVLWLSIQREELLKQVARAEQIAAAAAGNVKAGLVTAIESEAAAAMLQKRRASLLAADASLVSESFLLRQTLGLPPEAIVRVVGEPRGDSSLPSEEDVLDAVEHTRLDIAALHAGYASQEAKLHAAVLSQFPKIGLGITRARDTSNVETLGFGVTLDLPIFDRGQGRIAVERATRQQLFDELAARTFEARSDTRRALAELRAVRPQVEEARRTAERLGSLANALEDAKAQGDADVVQLTQAQNDAADAVLESLRFHQQEAELRIALEVATGKLIGGSQP